MGTPQSSSQFTGQGQLGFQGLLGSSLKEDPDFFSSLSPCCSSPDLQREVEELNAEILKAQEEVSFLSTYMDHEYPVRSVQIANHIRLVQQAKDSQQVREPLAPISRSHGR